MFQELKTDLEGTAFLFIRHGESLDNLANVVPFNDGCQGLSPLGHQQAADAANYLSKSGIGLDMIISSPILRAKQTAEIISSKNNIKILESTLLQEQYLGEWEGISWDIVLPLLKSGKLPPNGETYTAFDQRIAEGLKLIISMNKKSVLVVSHGGFWYGLNKIFSKTPLNMPRNIELRAVEIINRSLVYSTKFNVSDNKKIYSEH